MLRAYVESIRLTDLGICVSTDLRENPTLGRPSVSNWAVLLVLEKEQPSFDSGPAFDPGATWGRGPAAARRPGSRAGAACDVVFPGQVP